MKNENRGKNTKPIKELESTHYRTDKTADEKGR